MSIPPDINDSLIDSANKAANGSDIIHRVGNEPEGSFIDTLSGPVPSIKEWLLQKGLSIDAEFSNLQEIFDQSQAERSDQFNTWLDLSGFENPPLVYVDGAPLQVDRATQLVERNSILYTVRRPASFPYTLTGTWSTDNTHLVVRADQALRQDLANFSGSGIVGFNLGVTGSVDQTIENLLREAISLKSFKDSADPDDTNAFNKAFAYAVTTAIPDSGGMGWAWSQKNVFIPPGDYVYNGAGIDIPDVRNLIITAIPNTVTIRLPSGVYLFNCKGSVLNTFLKGIQTIGGAGMIHYESTAVNVRGQHVIEDFKCSNYTVCAISNESVDMPYFKITRGQLAGVAAGGTVGIALGGYIDGLEIRNVEFLRNKYHLKLGPRLSGNARIEACDFIQFNPGIVEADVWIVPNPDTVASSGQSIVFSLNKFGPENVSTSKQRFLIADELAGATRGSRHHSTVISTGNVTGLTIQHNNLSAASAPMTAPLIRSYVPKFAALQFGPNIYVGAPWTHLCEFMGGELIDSGSDYTTKTWNIDLNGANNNGISGNPPFAMLTNYFMGIAYGVQGVMQTSRETLMTNTSIGDDACYLELVRKPNVSNIDVVSGIGRTAVADVYGDLRGAQLTYPSASTTMNASATFTSANVRPGEMAWVEMDLKQSAATPLKSVLVRVASFSTPGVALSRRIYIDPVWRTISVPFVMPKTASLTTWQVTVSAESVNFVAGVSDSFCLGRLFGYHGKQRAAGGHVRTLETGFWNGGHIILGTFHIWVTAAGVLRIKNGAPTFEMDGVPVGAQT